MGSTRGRKRVMNTGFDLCSNPLHRVAKHYFLGRFIPHGSNQGGGGVKCLLVLWVSCYFGRPLFWFATRFQRAANLLLQVRQRLPFL